jgi:hypothetical protein
MPASVSCAGGAVDHLVRNGTWLVICAVPFFDAWDRLIERRIVPVTVEVDIAVDEAGARRAALDAATSAAGRAVRRRLRKLERRARTTLAEAAAREGGIRAASHNELAPGEAQPGLFDRREARAFASQWRDEERLEFDASRRISYAARPILVRAGEPQIEMILRRR